MKVAPPQPSSAMPRKPSSPRLGPRCRRRKSEHDALAAALEHGGGSAIASLSAEPGYERALAAALGEDADAAVGEGDSPRRWTGSEPQPSDPPCRPAPSASPTMSARPPSWRGA